MNKIIKSLIWNNSSILNLHLNKNITINTINTISIFHANNLNYGNKYVFSTDKKKQQQPIQQDLSDVRLVKGTANYFYRRSIRRLTQADRQFNHHHMLRMIKLSKTKKDILLSFQAYCNYIGRRVIMPSTVMDKFLKKAIQNVNNQLTKQQIKNQVNRQDMDHKIRQKIQEFMHLHDYLHYFPHYDATQLLFQHFLIENAHQQEIVTKFISSISQKLLIKFNQKCFMILADALKNQQLNHINRQKIIKMIIFRSLNLWNHYQWTHQQLINIFCQSIKNMGQAQEISMISLKGKHQQYLLLLQNVLKEKEDLRLRLTLASTYILNNNFEKGFDFLQKISSLESQQQGRVINNTLKGVMRCENQSVDKNDLKEKLNAWKQSKNISWLQAEQSS